MSVSRRHFLSALTLVVVAGAARADTDPAPVALVRNLSSTVLDAVRNDPELKSGDLRKIKQLVEVKILPFLDFRQMTAAATGRNWRQATPEQQQQLQLQFKQLLIHTYSGAVRHVRDQQVQFLPFRAAADADNVVVRTRVVSSSDVIQLDYRLQREGDTWKITDINVMGIWLVDNYRSVFAQEISKGGIDGLIKTLSDRNQQLDQGTR